jgi:hypothetical protein
VRIALALCAVEAVFQKLQLFVLQASQEICHWRNEQGWQGLRAGEGGTRVDMPAESWGTGEARGLRRKWYLGSLIVGVVLIIASLASLALGHPAGSLAGLVIGLVGTLRVLSVKGHGIDPSKSTIDRVRNREFRKYGRPF